MKNNQKPIGIFDSGIGGLTVAHAVTELLPNESIIYFGDTVHAPWGDKSTEAIQTYSTKICEMLLHQDCKLILIACNTASSAAFELVKEFVGNKAHVIDVIDPAIDHIRDHYATKQVGLIGTKKTIQSNIYKKKIDDLNLNIHLKSLAAPLLVPLIEEGFSSHHITAEVLKIYLSNPVLENIEALILGCTHYPLIKAHIQAYYQDRIEVIDSSTIVAKALKDFLISHDLQSTTKNSVKKFYVSDYTPTAVDSARMFFGESVTLEHYPIWD